MMGQKIVTAEVNLFDFCNNFQPGHENFIPVNSTMKLDRLYIGKF